MMTNGHHRASSKSTRAPLAPSTHATLTALQSGIPINPSKLTSPIIKDLRRINLLNEFYPFQNNKTHVQETVEIIPQPVSCERIFYSYIDDRTDTRQRTYIKLDQGVYVRSNDCGQMYTNDHIMKFFHNIEYDHRFKFDFYSTTLYIFPKQRNEKFISEIRYLPEHIIIKYKTTLEVLESSDEHYYENLPDFQHLSKNIFYRI